MNKKLLETSKIISHYEHSFQSVLKTQMTRNSSVKFLKSTPDFVSEVHCLQFLLLLFGQRLLSQNFAVQSVMFPDAQFG